MDRSRFSQLLQSARHASLNFARGMVHQNLRDSLRYDVLLNQSCDAHRSAEEVVYPEDDDKSFVRIAFDEVIDILWRQGMCPVWIDLSVKCVTDRHTVLQLLCAGRYIADEMKMYYARSAMGPFGIKSPVLTMDYRTGNRFSLPTAE